MWTKIRVFRFGAEMLGVCLILAVGCNTDASIATPIQTATTVVSLPTAIPTVIASPVPTSTPMPTYTTPPTPIVTPTLTPYPTLPPAEAQKLILSLYENNGGCRLPCWWGITLGQTSWQQAKSLFESLAAKFYEPDPGFPEVMVPVSQSFDLFGGGFSDNFFTLKNGRVAAIETQLKNVAAYELPTMLDTYGQPDEVFLGTHAGEGAGFFNVIIFYSQQGILAMYEVGRHANADQLVGCPQSDAGIYIFLWQPQGRSTFEDVQHNTTSYFSKKNYYRPLADVTKLNVKTFYETFKNPNNQTCVETPDALWPT